MKKRSFSKRVIAVGGLMVGGIVGLPSLLAIFSPSLRRRDDETWQAVGPLDEFPLGEVIKSVVRVPRDDWARSLREKGVFVLREAADQVVVYSRNCTDLGCPITWDPGSEWFFCPCHGGIFSKDGERQAGPPKIPLYRYATRVRDGLLEIDLNSLPPML
jgi:menaquinol-cytochrome c reductase iron-sulfur subunit